MSGKARISPKTISRLSLYRRLLAEYRTVNRTEWIYSHELAHHAGVSAAQVRRDIMSLGYSGTPNTGYEIRPLIEKISAHIDAPEGQQVALVGIGNLGKAIMAYFVGRSASLQITAAFDIDPAKTGRVLYGCRCYNVSEIPQIIPQKKILVAILTAPATAAQEIAELLASSGIRGILNFAPVTLKLPPYVYVEHWDMAIALEKVAFFARKSLRR